MRHTLKHEPEFFLYYNNGVTIVCDSAEKVSRSGRDVLRLINPQIINGQQTTRTVFECSGGRSKATVLGRVISVPRETDSDAQRFETLVSRIVAATNWQNAIRPSDLRSNDRRQIEIERNLRKLDYQYLRKRQSKGEARRRAGVKHRFLVSKEELAQVVAASDLDPLIVRTGKEQLFEEPYYEDVFPNSDVNYYLPRYWLGRHVTRRAKGYPERGYAKWLVHYFVWQRLTSLLGSKSLKRLFWERSQRGFFKTLERAIDVAYRASSVYYRLKRGSGARQIDPSSFYKRVGHHTEFEKFWSRSVNKYRRRFNQAWSEFARELESLSME